MMQGQSFEAEVRNAIREKVPEKYAMMMFSKPLRGMRGISGNSWLSDIVVERIDDVKEQLMGNTKVTTFSLKGIRAIIECKDSESSRPAAFRNQMLRAYGQLGDLQNLKCPRFVVVRKKIKSKSKFDFDKYFATIGVRIVDWSNDTQRQDFLGEIESLVNAPIKMV
jgi:hypothetical protein